MINDLGLTIYRYWFTSNGMQSILEYRGVAIPD